MDSGASRHMTGKIALLYDVKNINGGYVGFTGNQGGRIIGEGTLFNGIVTFERVNYIAELENNLLSISQICDRMYTTHFTDKECLILKPGFVIPEEWIIMRAPRVNDLYVLDMSVATTTTGQAHCFVSRATEKESRLWHRKMGHIHLRKMNHLVHNDLVLGVHVKGFHLEGECISCVKGKQKKKSHPTKQVNSVSRPLERLHMDLFGPVNVKSITGDYYYLVVTDDYSRFSLMALFKKIENLYQRRIKRIRSDNGTEFKNSKMEEFCDERGILHEFSAPYTPQQNGVTARKNQTLIEMTRTMLADSSQTNQISEQGANQNVTNLEGDVDVPSEVMPRTLSYHPEELIIGELQWGVRTRRQIDQGLTCFYSTVAPLQTDFSLSCFILQIEPRTYKEALTEDSWVNAMQEELSQFEKLGVWKLVDLPDGHRKINTKWVFKCKRDDRGVLVRNKARLVFLGFSQQEGIDFTEVYAPVARLEAIRIFLAFASWKNFKVYQLDVKSAFLYGKVKEEVYVGQPPGVTDPIHKNKVYLLDKALYGLHQAPRAWYETLSQHLLANSFIRGKVDATLLTKEVDGHLLIV
ncbi:putative RNA-directed DNA polymerase [Helianthus annuus]|nr:putative RNA-directed DNA polymerase [Helianthus annuus]